MKKVVVGFFLLTSFSLLASSSLDKYITSFDYAARKEMKMKSSTLIDLIEDKKALLVDIRFPEEYKTWSVDGSVSIPINKLPGKIQFLKDEMKKGKVIVTACPHKDRAIIAMTFLRSKGIKAHYLVDGLTGMIEGLRGDNAKYFQANKQ